VAGECCWSERAGGGSRSRLPRCVCCSRVQGSRPVKPILFEFPRHLFRNRIGTPAASFLLGIEGLVSGFK